MRHPPMTMINTIANAHIYLSNDFISSIFPLIRSTAELSPDAIKALEGSRNNLLGIRAQHFASLLLMTKLVAAGVILEGPELVYEISQVIKRSRKRPTREHAPALITFVGLVGWILVSVGVAGEFWVDGKVNSDDDNIQSINIQLLRDAGSSAGAAAGAAKIAHDEADAAKTDAGIAKTDAGNAKTLASGARHEADSFENDIKSVKQNAADAESHLAEALKQAAAAQAELNRLKSPRLLASAIALSTILRQFAGTEYTFVLVSDDTDSVDLLKQIDSALQLAGWKRAKPTPTSVIGLPMPDFGKDFIIAVGAQTGIEIEVDSTESIDSLRSTPAEGWPPLVKAAGTLKNALAALITPAAEDNLRKDLVVTPGPSTVIRIAVGKKP
jgi:hypothetical protein